MHFADRLTELIKKKNSVLCVGLDPQAENLPVFLLKKMSPQDGQSLKVMAHAYLEFNKGIMDAVCDFVVAVKPQLAFYEELGHEGIWAFEETCRYAREKGLIVIADGKRNDIGSTAEAYARAYLGKVYDVDALTVNPYLGFDGVRPFLKLCQEEGKGIFILVRTSNPSSGDLQTRVTKDEQISIAELVGHFVESWGNDYVGESGYSFVGAVVGATFPKEASKLRKLMPRTIFLVPGFGAQGATAEDTKPCFDKEGLGALVVSARGILYAYQEQGYAGLGEAYAEAARDAALKMREELNKVRE